VGGSGVFGREEKVSEEDGVLSKSKRPEVGGEGGCGKTKTSKEGQ